MWYTTLTILVFLSSHGLVQAYMAAVIEYYPETMDSANNTIKKNLNEYRSFAEKAKAQSVDIIVFPEYGLTTLVTDPQDFAIEISDDNHIIKELHAIAVEHQLYLVVNLLEKIGSYYYNTDLVFDRNGSIILKYRKINLYEEPKLTAGTTNQNLIFTSDFGVTFGIFTCFDILFRNPSRTILQNDKVTDIIFPTAWVSKTPFYISTSVQQAYAMSNGVNLLAANYAKPSDGRGGSGIYLPDGTIVESYIADTPSSKPIIRSVTKLSGRPDTTTCSTLSAFGLPGETKSNVTNYITGKVFNATAYQFKSVDLSQNHAVTDICDRDFCCTFEITVASTSLGVYKVVAFDGVVNYEQSQAHLRFCSLVACETDSNDTCGGRTNVATNFTKITVKGNLVKDETAFYSPVTLNSFLLPLTGTKFCDTNNATNSSFVQLTTLHAQSNVLVFGLFGRTDAPVTPKNRDDGEGEGSSVSATHSSFWLILFLVFVSRFYAF